jgi:hypothetical protein
MGMGAKGLRLPLVICLGLFWVQHNGGWDSSRFYGVLDMTIYFMDKGPAHSPMGWCLATYYPYDRLRGFARLLWGLIPILKLKWVFDL